MSENEDGPAVAGSDEKLQGDGRPTPAEQDATRSEQGDHDPETSEDTASGGGAD